MSRIARGTALGTTFVLAALGCSAAPGAPNTGAGAAAEPAPSGALLGNPRFFHVMPDDAYWITHDDARDRIVASGSRLELSPAGEVLSAAWESERTSNGDLLVGGLALSPQAGGGYLFWSQARIFRSTEFTGPLVPVGLGVPDAADTLIRGARNGLRGAVIVTDAGPRELLPGAAVAGPYPDPAVLDVVALDASRAVRLDVLGRSSFTVDGGKTWGDASQVVGYMPRGIGSSGDEIWFEMNQGRVMLGREGTLREADGYGYRYFDYQRPFQVLFRGTRAERDDSFWWGYRDTQPLQSVLASGVRLADGTGFGVLRGAVTKVDLQTGKVLSIATDWLPNGLECQPFSHEGGVLFACASDEYGTGGFLLRSDGASPPVMERFFSDSGTFVADDAGAFAYTGSCKADERYVDPEEYYGRYGRYGRYGYEGEDREPTVEPVICIRRSADDWVERRLELDEDTQLVAWIPRKDGTAVALVRGKGRGQSLPDLARDSQRESSQSGVRVVRVYQDVEDWYWPGQASRMYYGRGGGLSTLIDRRYRALDDGTIVGWLSQGSQGDTYSYGASTSTAGGTLSPSGRTEMFALPATPLQMAFGGAFAVLTTREGKVFETTNRGRSWREVGRTALAPASMGGTCSSLGCAFAAGGRLGWGTPASSPSVAEAKREDAPKAAGTPATLRCEPQGLPKPEASIVSPAAAQLGSSARISIQTTFGATMELIRETPDAVSSASPYSSRPYMPWPPPVPTATPSAAPSAKAAAKAAPTRTHTLVFRPPLDPLAPIVRHNATNAAVGNRGRMSAVPLLGVGGDVTLLYTTDSNEALVDRNDLVTIPFFDSRRYYYSSYDSAQTAPGLRTAQNRALLLADARRRSGIEEHGLSPQKPPLYFNFDRDMNRRRAMSLGRRDDGSVGLIVLDAAAPETAGVMFFDRATTTVGAVTKLAAWSTLVTADDPVCRADHKAFRALISVDPTSWFTLDPEKLPGIALARQGIALVRWGEERVCLEAVDLAVIDPRRRPDTATGESLVVRWSAPAGKGAAPAAIGAGATGALRSLELLQPLTCSLDRPKK